jgi:hypothetical protein
MIIVLLKMKLRKPQQISMLVRFGVQLQLQLQLQIIQLTNASTTPKMQLRQTTRMTNKTTKQQTTLSLATAPVRGGTGLAGLSAGASVPGGVPAGIIKDATAQKNKRMNNQTQKQINK